MVKDYFRKVHEQTPTRLWINNVTRREAALALEVGAVGCTQNPSYTWKELSSEDDGEYARELLRKTLSESTDDRQVEALLQAKLVKLISDKFMDTFERTKGKEGYVSIQSDPTNETAEFILEEAFRNRKLNPNIMIKVPAVQEAFKAIEILIAERVPLNITEVMGVGQAIHVCEMHRKITEAITSPAPFYLSHIAGIYDDYLRKYVIDNKVGISDDVLWQAGLAVARKVYRMMRERGYSVGFIAGGARGLHHFTELVGGDVAITINWQGTADKLLESPPPVVSRINSPVSDYVIDELVQKLPDFRRGYLMHELEPKEFGEFGPVVHFRNMFIESWTKVLKAIASARRSG